MNHTRHGNHYQIHKMTTISIYLFIKFKKMHCALEFINWGKVQTIYLYCILYNASICIKEKAWGRGGGGVVKQEWRFKTTRGAMLLTNVPLTWVETCPFSLSDTSLDKPKSATFAVKFSSNNILVDFTSLWIMGGLASSCKYASPLAEPRAMRSLLFQSRWISDLPATHIDCLRCFINSFLL